MRYSIDGHHVHSHNGDPWNELADSLCIFFKSRPTMVRSIPGVPFTKEKVLQLEWHAALKNDYISGCLVAEPSHKFNEYIGIPPEIIAQKIDAPSYMLWDGSVECVFLKRKYAQFNVQTLKDPKVRKILGANFLQLGVFVGCFQEARCAKS
jgi:hypothetical protein